MNKKKEFCFIICTNDERKYKECEAYIQRLRIPEGYTLDVITIQGADSICSAYNAGMQASEAKYKIYMHQDVLIIEKNFLYYIKDCFERDAQIGMLGMVGAAELPQTGIMWDGQRYGSLYETHVHETTKMHEYAEAKDTDVVLIDGLLMATRYDIPWREELFDKWDFYDASQSMEFQRAGYRVVVPYQESPWCIHDCGYLNLERYEEERQKFVQEYVVAEKSALNK